MQFTVLDRAHERWIGIAHEKLDLNRGSNYRVACTRNGALNAEDSSKGPNRDQQLTILFGDTKGKEEQKAIHEDKQVQNGHTCAGPESLTCGVKDDQRPN